MAKVRAAAGATDGDLLVLVVADGEDVPEQKVIGKRLPARDRRIFKAAGLVRLSLAQQFAARHRAFEKKGTADDYKFLWVTDFPMYEWDEETKTWNGRAPSLHLADEEDLKAGRLTSDPGAVRALAYDIVLNGTELGSGSIRIHQQDGAVGDLPLARHDGRRGKGTVRFLPRGAGPTARHRMAASRWDCDRIAMILAGAPSLREVIAFPKTAKAIDLMVDAPTPVSEQQMRELHLKTVTRS